MSDGGPGDSPVESGLRGAAEDEVAFFLPLHYESGYAYPLLVWIAEPTEPPHAAGEPGSHCLTLRELMPRLSLRNFIGASVVLGEGLEERVARAVEATQRRFRIEPARVFLGGCHACGTAALRQAFGTPQRLAGVLSLGGPFPPRAGLLARLERLRHLPIFLATWSGLPPATLTSIEGDVVLARTAGLPLQHHVEPLAQASSDQPLQNILRAAHHWMMEVVSRR